VLTFDKLDVTKRGLIVGAVGKATVQDVTQPDGVLNLFALALEGTEQSPGARQAATSLRARLDPLRATIREQVGLGEFDVGPGRDPDISQFVYAGIEDNGVPVAEVVHLPASGLCYSLPVEVPGVVLGGGSGDAADNAALEIARHLDGPDAVEALSVLVDRVNRLDPFAASRAVRAVSVSSTGIEGPEDSHLPPVVTRVPRH
jgi:hypothetical protein